MVWKPVGTLLLILAGILLVWNYFQQRHRQQESLAELIWDMEHIATEIRWQHRHLPDILEELTKGPYNGEAFENIILGLTEYQPLQKMWNTAFSSYPPELSRVMTRVDLSGDEQHLTQGVLYAAEELKQLQRESRQKKGEKDKLLIAMVGTGIGLLIILLM